jgi:hypothetical protein
LPLPHLIALALLATGMLFAASAGTRRTWSAGAPGNASVNGNWTPTGPFATGDTAFFNTGNFACTWDVNVTLGAWDQTSAYTGVVTILTQYTGFDTLRVTGDVSVMGGQWRHEPNSSSQTDRLMVKVGGKFRLGVGARINADSLGYAAGMGPGTGSASDGGAYGGVGGDNGGGPTGKITYGMATAPMDIGSGGSAGKGGGAVCLLVADSAIIGDSVSACGMAGTGAGAGGSIFIKAAYFGGSGALVAHGGASSASGGGGGGRIAVVLTSGNSLGSVLLSALGGASTANMSGAAGTIYTELQPQGSGMGDLVIRNNGLSVATGVVTALNENSTVGVKIGRLVVCDSARFIVGGNDTLRIAGIDTTLTLKPGATFGDSGFLFLGGRFFADSGVFYSTGPYAHVTYTGQPNDSPVTVMKGPYKWLAVENDSTLFRLPQVAVEVNDSLVIAAGTLQQDSAWLNVFRVLVRSKGVWRNNGVACDSINSGGGVCNDGSVSFNGGGSGCGADPIQLRSTTGSPVPWMGEGRFFLCDVDMSNQNASVPINVFSGTNGVGNSGWTFSAGCAITWGGAGADSNWTTSANWVGGVSPTGSDMALFDGTTAKGCKLTGPVTVQALLLTPDFKCSFDFGPNSLTITSGDADFSSGGPIYGASGKLIVDGASGQQLLGTRQGLFIRTLEKTSGAGLLRITGPGIAMDSLKVTIGTINFGDSTTVDSVGTSFDVTGATVEMHSCTVKVSAASVNFNAASVVMNYPGVLMLTGNSPQTFMAKAGAFNPGLVQRGSGGTSSQNGFKLNGALKVMQGTFSLNGYMDTVASISSSGGTGTLDFGSSVVWCQGNADFSGLGSLNAGTGTLEFCGGSAQTFIPKSGATHPNIVQGGPGGTTLSGNDLVAGKLLVMNGSFGTSTQTLTCSSLKIAGGSLNAAGGNLDVNGDDSLVAGSVNAPGSGKTYTVSGNLIHSGGTFTPGAGTVTLDATTAGRFLSPGAMPFNNLAFNGAGGQWTLVNNSLGVCSLSVLSGQFIQGTTGVACSTATVGAGGVWQNHSTGAISIGSGGLTNNGVIDFNANGTACGQTDDIAVTSTSGGIDRNWQGSGTFNLTDVNITDQNATVPVTAYSSTNTSNTGSWTFDAGCPPVVWTGAGADSNWTTTVNWNGGVVPTAGDSVVFNASTTKGCKLNANATVKAIMFQGAYTGSIAFQSACTLSVSGNADFGGPVAITQTSGALKFIGSGPPQMFTPKAGALFPAIIQAGTGGTTVQTYGFKTKELRATAGQWNLGVNLVDSVGDFINIGAGGWLNFGSSTLRVAAPTVDFSTIPTLNPGAGTLEFCGSSQTFTPKVGAAHPRIVHSGAGSVSVKATRLIAPKLLVSGGTVYMDTAFTIDTIDVAGAGNLILDNADSRNDTCVSLTGAGSINLGSSWLTASGNVNLAGFSSVTTGSATINFNPAGASAFQPPPNALMYAIRQIQGTTTIQTNGLKVNYIYMQGGTLNFGAGVIDTIVGWISYTAGTLDFGSARVVYASNSALDVSTWSITPNLGTLVFNHPGSVTFTPKSGAAVPRIEQAGAGTLLLSTYRLKTPKLTVSAGILNNDYGFSVDTLRVTGGTTNLGTGMTDSAGVVQSTGGTVDFQTSTLWTTGNVNFSGLTTLTPNTGKLHFAATSGTQSFDPKVGQWHPPLIKDNAGAVSVANSLKTTILRVEAGAWSFGPSMVDTIVDTLWLNGGATSLGSSVVRCGNVFDGANATLDFGSGTLAKYGSSGTVELNSLIALTPGTGALRFEDNGASITQLYPSLSYPFPRIEVAGIGSDTVKVMTALSSAKLLHTSGGLRFMTASCGFDTVLIQGGTVDFDACSLAVNAGSADFSGAARILRGAGKLSFTANNNQSLIAHATDTLPLLMKSGTGVLSLATNDLRAASVRVKSGQFDGNSRAVKVEGSVAVDGGTFDVSGSDVDIDGSLNYSGSVIAPVSGKSFTVAQDVWSSGGAFTHSSGKVTLDGVSSNRTVHSVGQRLYDLDINRPNTNVVFDDSASIMHALVCTTSVCTLSFASGYGQYWNSAYIDGQGSKTVLKPSAGSPWRVNVLAATDTFEHVDVRQSDANSSIAQPIVNLATSTNWGGNTNWRFFVPSPSITSPTQASMRDSLKVRFAWTAAAGASKYYLMVRDTTHFVTVIQDSTVGLTYDTLLNDDANYFVEVASNLDFAGFGGTKINCADSTNKSHRGFSVNVPSPSITSPTQAAVLDSMKLRVTWSSVSGASKYYILLWDSTNTIAQVKDSTSLTYYDTTVLDNRAYYAEIASNLDFAGFGASSINTSSAGNKAHRGFSVDVQAPSITAPTQAAILDSMKLHVTWSSVSGASKYYILLYDSTNVIAGVKDSTSLLYYDTTVLDNRAYYVEIASSKDFQGFGTSVINLSDPGNKAHRGFSVSMPAPTVGTITIADNNGYTQDIDPAFTFAGVTGADSVRYGINDSVSMSAWKWYAVTDSVNLGTEGGKRVWAQFRSYGPKFSAKISDSTTYDITAPTNDSIAVTDTNGFVRTANPTLTFFAIGADSMRVALVADTNTAGWMSYAGIWSGLNIGAEGMKYLFAQYKDNAGNVTVWVRDSTVYDTTGPTSSPSVASRYNASTWPGAFGGSSSDGISGVDSVIVQLSYQTGGQYWDGSGWTVTPISHHFAVSSGWSLSAAFPSGNGTYSIQSIAIDKAGNVQASPTAMVFIYDGTPPASVTNLTASWSSLDTVAVSWNPSISPDVDSVMVLYRSNDRYPNSRGDGVLVGVFPPSTTSTRLSGMLEKQMLYVAAFVKESDGNWSGADTAGLDTAWVPDLTQPRNVTALQAVNSLRDTVILSWIGSTSSDADSLVIQYRTDGQYPLNQNDGTRWIRKTLATPTDTMWGGVAGTTYRYGIFVRDTAGNWCAASPAAQCSVAVRLPAPPDLQSIALADQNGFTADRDPRIDITLVGPADSMRIGFDTTGGAWRTWVPVDSIDISAGPNGMRTVWAQVKRRNGTTSAWRSDSTFYDTTAPVVTVLTSGTFDTASWPGYVAGNATDSGSGVLAVWSVVQRASDGLFWKGSAWSIDTAWQPVMLIPGVGGRYYVDDSIFTDGAYTVWSFGIDRLSNKSRPVTSTLNFVRTPPVARFAALPSFGPAPLMVAFVDSSSGSVSQWLWSFGDSTASSTSRTASHVYTKPGTFTAQLTVSGPGGMSSATRAVTVIDTIRPLPPPSFAVSATSCSTVVATWNASWTGNRDTVVVCASDSTMPTGKSTARFWAGTVGSAGTVSLSHIPPQGVRLYVTVFTRNRAGNWSLFDAASSDTVDMPDGVSPVNDLRVAMNAAGDTAIRVTWRVDSTGTSDAHTIAWALSTTPAAMTGLDRVRTYGDLDTTVGGTRQSGWWYLITLVRDRAGNASAMHNDSVMIRNSAPTFAPLADAIIREDTVWTQQVLATDFNCDKVTLSAVVAPSGLILDSTGMLGWTPDDSGVGTRAVVLSADDGVGGVTLDTFMLTVTNVNEPPTVRLSGSDTAWEDSAFHVGIVVTDPDLGDSVQVVSMRLPAWMSRSGLVLTGRPTNAQVGVDSVSMVVSDKAGLTASVKMRIVVVNTNDVPVVAGSLRDTTREKLAFASLLTVQDIDAADSVTLQWVKRPLWLDAVLAPVASQPGQWTLSLSGTPQQQNVGMAQVALRVADRAGAVALIADSILVLDTNDPPSVTVRNRAISGGAVRFVITGSDDYTAGLLLEKALRRIDVDSVVAQALDTLKTAEYFPLLDGRYEFSVTAIDADSLRSVRAVDTFTIAGATQRAFADTAGWHMMSVPARVVDASAVKADGYLSHWDESGSERDVYGYYTPSAEINQVAAGRSYWRKAATASSVELTAQDVAESTMVISLNKGAYGWNQIATPYVFPVRWDNGATLWRWDQTTNDFEESSDGVLRPWEGYWVLADSAQQVAMPMAPVYNLAPLAKKSRTYFAGTGNWRVQVSLRGAGFQDADNFIGYSDKARDGWDPLDRPEPPRVSGGSHAFFDHPEWKRAVREYASDVRRRWDSDVNIFQIGLAPAEQQQTAALDVKGVDGLRDVYLFMASGDSLVRLSDVSSVPVTVGAQTAYATVFATGDARFAQRYPARFAMSAPYPNPFGPVVKIRYTLPYRFEKNGRLNAQPYVVRLTIYDVKGRVVCQVVNRPQAPGSYRIVWQARSSSGRPVASGQYLCELTAGKYRQVKRLVTVR